MGDNCDLTIKLLIVGDTTVGKTNFISRFIENKFNSNYMSSSGIDLKSSQLQIKNKNVRIQIWDTAGQEKYKAITKNLFLKVMGAIVIYDITSEKSYINLKSWVQLIKEECGSHMNIIIVGNKSDLIDERKIEEEVALNYAKEQKAQYIETSCVTGDNIKKAVTILCEKILEAKESADDSSFMLDSSVYGGQIKKRKFC